MHESLWREVLLVFILFLGVASLGGDRNEERRLKRACGGHHRKHEGAVRVATIGECLRFVEREGLWHEGAGLEVLLKGEVISQGLCEVLHGEVLQKVEHGCLWRGARLAIVLFL